MWRVKEVSETTKVTIRTLHYYDRINLLTPSGRLSNGYRLYSENDITTLKQIIALKFFGFSLSQIKKILSTNKDDMLCILKAQRHYLEADLTQLIEMQKKLLTGAIKDLEKHKMINWYRIVDLIELYSPTDKMA